MALTETDTTVSIAKSLDSLAGISGRRLVLHTARSDAITADEAIMVPETPRRLWLLVQNRHTTNVAIVQLGNSNVIRLNSGGFASFQIDATLPWTGSVTVTVETPTTAGNYVVLEARVED